MRLTLLFILLCFQVLAQKSAADTLKTNGTIITSHFATPIDTTVYRIKIADKLRIRNLNALEIIYPQGGNLSVGASTMTNGQLGSIPPYMATVDLKGQIILPQIGRIKVAGLTKAEAGTEIERRYQDLITNPVFDVEIANLRIKVLGAVAKQGVITLEEEKMTLGEVIALSGGIDFTTADRTIKLIRTRSGLQQEISYDVRNLSDPVVANIPIFDGDYVFIPPSKSSLRIIKNQKFSSIVQPVALTLNAIAILLGLYITISRN
ncbi:polysaccharide biosynthesis/export family protein [Runella sp.]|uniref:polysaccharide biosynthesis/export family protein n=1 Tax=Runella sp. TaxID=1960881 RepID=UPI003D09885F